MKWKTKLRSGMNWIYIHQVFKVYEILNRKIHLKLEKN